MSRYIQNIKVLRYSGLNGIG